MKIVDAVSEGGQTWMHRFRMQAQLARIVFKFSLIVGLLVLSLLLFTLDRKIFIGSYYNLKAQAVGTLFATTNVKSSLWKEISYYSSSQETVEVSTRIVEQATGR